MGWDSPHTHTHAVGGEGCLLPCPAALRMDTGRGNPTLPPLSSFCPQSRRMSGSGAHCRSTSPTSRDMPAANEIRWGGGCLGVSAFTFVSYGN